MKRRKLTVNRLPSGLIIVAMGCLLVIAQPGLTSAADVTVNTGYFGNIAIQGYDPVAYFIEGKAVKGSEEYKLKWLGAYWHFSNAEHRKLFSEKPQDYAPQYGGHCATGMAISGGLTKDIDPEAWAIIDNKLYLNYSKETNSLLAGNVVTVDKADANWEKRANAVH